MIEVQFYDMVDDEKLKFAVIISKYKDRWVFCKHRKRSTWEVPGGHREPGETILDTARRELYEETGAVRFELRRLAVYSVTRDTSDKERSGMEESFGMLYFAAIETFSREISCELVKAEGKVEPFYPMILDLNLGSEIEKIMITEELPENWTYPDIQPRLLEKYSERNA